MPRESRTNPDDLDHLVTLRRHLHAHPERSGHEHATAQAIAEFLAARNPSSLLTQVGGTGVVALFDSGHPGPTVMIRAELDALPIQEHSGVPHASTVPGVAHLCGHDGHAVMVAALASSFTATPPARGRVMLLFQPAEENGNGAAAMLADPRWGTPALPEPDRCLALHNLPAEPLGRVVLAEPVFSSASVGLSFTLQGLPGHCSAPEHARNPLHALAPIITDLLALQPDAPESRQIVLTHATSGEDAVFGTSPATARLNATLRARTDAALAQLIDLARATVRRHADAAGLSVSDTLHDEFHASRCDASVVETVRAAALDLGLGVTQRAEPFRWSEDFGRFTARCPGVLFGLGAGEHQPPLHHPDYDFPDDLIPIGVPLLENTARRLLEPEA